MLKQYLNYWCVFEFGYTYWHLYCDKTE